MQTVPDMALDTTLKQASYLVPLLSRAQAAKYHLAFVAWIAASGYFWVWWFQPSNNIHTLSFVVLTLSIGWLFFVQAYFLAVFLRARVSNARIEDLGLCRVAMVTTKTPAEPFSVVRATLEAMLAQEYPHDTWLADEEPDEETLEWCFEHGVKVSSRKGNADYHLVDWPRRTKCKEGNLAYFYDHFGYQNYDFVAQLDSDHVALPGYLSNLLRPFVDARVGYVSAPSICGSNASDNWSARTRLFSEGMFHGILQAGYTNGLAPVCIGSHYAVRTSALKEIGGLGPELAEDHSTSMIFNAHGWRGACNRCDRDRRGSRGRVGFNYPGIPVVAQPDDNSGGTHAPLLPESTCAHAGSVCFHATLVPAANPVHGADVCAADYRAGLRYPVCGRDLPSVHRPYAAVHAGDDRNRLRRSQRRIFPA